METITLSEFSLVENKRKALETLCCGLLLDAPEDEDRSPS